MFRKYADCHIEGFCRPSVGRTASAHHVGSFDYTPNTDGRYLYVAVRACTGDVPNLNYDMLPSEELRTAYKTFIGSSVFLNHKNDDPEAARGAIVDAKWHDEDPEDQWVEILMEMDEERCPKLCELIKSGEIDTVSMGCEVRDTTCSICGNVAEFPFEYCEHVQQKGREFQGKLAYEICNGIDFFECSWVYDPADPTAHTVEMRDDGERTAARFELLHEDEYKGYPYRISRQDGYRPYIWNVLDVPRGSGACYTERDADDSAVTFIDSLPPVGGDDDETDDEGAMDDEGYSDMGMEQWDIDLHTSGRTAGLRTWESGAPLGMDFSEDYTLIDGGHQCEATLCFGGDIGDERYDYHLPVTLSLRDVKGDLHVDTCVITTYGYGKEVWVTVSPWLDPLYDANGLPNFYDIMHSDSFLEKLYEAKTRKDGIFLEDFVRVGSIQKQARQRLGNIQREDVLFSDLWFLEKNPDGVDSLRTGIQYYIWDPDDPTLTPDELSFWVVFVEGDDGLYASCYHDYDDKTVCRVKTDYTAWNGDELDYRGILQNNDIAVNVLEKIAQDDPWFLDMDESAMTHVDVYRDMPRLDSNYTVEAYGDCGETCFVMFTYRESYPNNPMAEPTEHSIKLGIYDDKGYGGGLTVLYCNDPSSPLLLYFPDERAMYQDGELDFDKVVANERLPQAILEQMEDDDVFDELEADPSIRISKRVRRARARTAQTSEQWGIADMHGAGVVHIEDLPRWITEDAADDISLKSRLLDDEGELDFEGSFTLTLNGTPVATLESSMEYVYWDDNDADAIPGSYDGEYDVSGAVESAVAKCAQKVLHYAETWRDDLEPNPDDQCEKAEFWKVGLEWAAGNDDWDRDGDWECTIINLDALPYV